MCPAGEPAVQPPWLSIVGLGERGWAGLGAEARNAIARAALVIGGARHLAMLPEQPGQTRKCWPSPLTDAIADILTRRGTAVCVLASGDPFWFGVGATLARHVPADEMRVWPQPSAFALAAARMGWALQHTTCLSVHGRALSAIKSHLYDGARLLLLSWDERTPAAVASLLRERGFGGSTLTVLEHMDGPDERRARGTARDWSHDPGAALNTMAVDCVADAGALTIANTPGRPADLFDNDSQISAAEIRAIVLSLLAPTPGERLWDIGAGSGAVGIEWMLAHAANRTLAVEARAERAERVRGNAERLGVPALECVTGQAPDALVGAPAPAAIFIGGGLTTAGLLEHCVVAIGHEPAGRIVATSVTVEGDAVLAAAVARHGGRLRRIAVSHAEPLGAFLGWAPARPVTIWHWRNDEETS